MKYWYHTIGPMGMTFLDVATHDPSSLRHRVLTALRGSAPMTRAEIARRTGLAPPTITALARDLLAERVVLETGPAQVQSARTGPRGTGLVLNPGLTYALGVDIGFRTFRVMLCDASGHEVGYAEQRLEPNHTSATGLPVIERLAAQTLAAAGCLPGAVVGAAVAVRAPVDSQTQRVAISGELAGWAGVGAADLAKVLGCPATLENDANLAALGEHVYGSGRGHATTITVKLHSGVGAGLIVDDRLRTGSHGGAGELGHVRVVARGELCRCGKRGCLDTRASIPALLAAGRENGAHADLDMPTLIRRVQAGERAETRLVHDAAVLVGRALVTANLLLVPEKVILVGALARTRNVVVDPIRRELERGAVPGTDTVPRVTLGELGDRPTVLGALALVLRKSGWLA